MDYEQHFSLACAPFPPAVDISFYYPSRTHEQFLESALANINSGLIAFQVVGEVGTGKTMMLRVLEERLRGDFLVAPVLNPYITIRELLRLLCKHWHLGPSLSGGVIAEHLMTSFRAQLNSTMADGSRLVLLVDEAQSLPEGTRDTIHQLIQFAEAEKRIHVIFFTKTERSWERSRPDAGEEEIQWPTVVFSAFSLSETVEYIQRRLELAGSSNEFLMSATAIRRIHEASGGRPGLINLICERSLMAAAITGDTVADVPHVQKALDSLQEELPPVPPEHVPKTRWAGLRIGTGILLLGVLVIGWWLWPSEQMTSTQNPVIPAKPQAGLGKGAQTEAGTSLAVGPTVGSPPAHPVSKAETPPGTTPPVSLASSSLTPVAGASVPMPWEVVHLPAGHRVVTIDLSSGQGRLWSGSEGGFNLKVDFKASGSAEAGLYILGIINKNRFIFTYPLANRDLFKPGPELWNMISQFNTEDVLPVLTYGAARQSQPDLVDKSKEIRGLIRDWATAWRVKDVDRLVQLYAVPFTYATEGGTKTRTYVKETLQTWIKQTAIQDGPLTSSLSDVVCLLNPGHKEQAVAVFNYKLLRGTKDEGGTMVLFFEQAVHGPTRNKWTIVAQLWVPES